jgi:hypothetical protein
MNIDASEVHKENGVKPMHNFSAIVPKQVDSPIQGDLSETTAPDFRLGGYAIQISSGSVAIAREWVQVFFAR